MHVKGSNHLTWITRVPLIRFKTWCVKRGPPLFLYCTHPLLNNITGDWRSLQLKNIFSLEFASRTKSQGFLTFHTAAPELHHKFTSHTFFAMIAGQRNILTHTIYQGAFGHGESCKYAYQCVNIIDLCTYYVLVGKIAIPATRILTVSLTVSLKLNQGNAVLKEALPARHKSGFKSLPGQQTLKSLATHLQQYL